MRYCEYCKCKIFDHEKVCSQCGAAISHSSEPKQEKPIDITIVETTISKSSTSPSSLRYLILLIVSIALGLAIGSAILKPSKSSHKQTASSNEPYKAPLEKIQAKRALNRSGYIAKYKKNDDGSSVLLYMNEDDNNFLGRFQNNSGGRDHQKLYFYGNLDNLNKAYVFHKKVITSNNSDESNTCTFDYKSMKTNCDDSKQNNTYDLASSFRAFIKKYNIKQSGLQEVVDLIYEDESNHSTSIEHALSYNNYSVDFNDDQLMITSQNNTLFHITFDSYGLSTNVMYTSQAREIEKNYLYSRKNEYPVDDQAQAFAKEDDYFWLSNYDDLISYANSYYFKYIEK